MLVNYSRVFLKDSIILIGLLQRGGWYKATGNNSERKAERTEEKTK